MKTVRGQKGFTLLEVVMAIGIFSILMVGINFLFISLYRQQGSSAAMIERTRVMNNLIDNVSRELREGNRGENGHFFIETAANDTITFYSDVDDDHLTEKVSYSLSASTLSKSVTQPGSDFQYTGTPTVTVICSEVQNGSTPMFTYYDENYSGTGSSMTLPVSVLNVKLVGVSLTTNSTNKYKSYPLHIETKIQLRNS